MDVMTPFVHRYLQFAGMRMHSARTWPFLARSLVAGIAVYLRTVAISTMSTIVRMVSTTAGPLFNTISYVPACIFEAYVSLAEFMLTRLPSLYQNSVLSGGTLQTIIVPPAVSDKAGDTITCMERSSPIDIGCFCCFQIPVCMQENMLLYIPPILSSPRFTRCAALRLELRQGVF